MAPRKSTAALTAPAPAPVDAAGLVSKALGFAQDGKFMSDEAAKAVADLAAALAAAAEREAVLEEKVRQSALDYLALDMQATEALEREAALVRERDEAIVGAEIVQWRELKSKLAAAEARVTAAEAERQRLEALLIEAKDHIAHNAPSLSMQSADYLLVSRIVAAIRKETT